ncbi:MAG: protein kinase [Candidatus Sulfotelmatobacter sp.]
MDAERWKRVDDLLQAALQVPAEQQEEFLRQQCGGDSELLEEVRSLLMAHREAGSFLELPAIDDANAITSTAVLDAPPAHSPITGQIVSHYRVLRRLGSGGMGVIYEAEDIKLGRRVAMKFLPGEVASDRVAFERLQQEARAASALDHPNICSIYELGEHQGQPFIVMQLLEGQTLREWIEGAPTQDTRSRLGQTLDLAIQMADGLEAAHQKGIIHRDIKPANVFITARGEAKILDFGLAKVVEDATPTVLGETTVTETAMAAANPGKLHLTRTGTTMGTAFYMSPEQVRAENLDSRTDLFSLGLVLYEMVTGQRAFAGETGKAVHDAILHREPKPVRQLNPAVSAGLEKIVNKAIEKDRKLRYQRGAEMRSALQTLRSASVLKRQPLSLWVSAAISAIVLILLITNISPVRTWIWGKWTETTTPAAIKPRRSVAVLGFKNLSRKPEDQWISTALTEMVSAELAAGQQIRAIPAENVAAMKIDLSLPEADSYSAGTLKKIRQNLGTDLVVFGSYLAMQSGSRRKLRIDLQSQDAVGGEIVAVISQDGAESDLSDLASRGGASLREKLGIDAVSEVEAKQVRATLPESAEASRYYSEGLAKLRLFDGLGARGLLEKAVAAEPQYALAHSALAEALSFLGYESRAGQEAKTAFDLSQNLPRESRLAIEARYLELRHDYSGAIQNYQTLYNFFPDNVDYGLQLAEAQVGADRGKDGVSTIARLRALPQPASDDPRIDLQEGRVVQKLSDFKREQQVAAAAVEKGQAQGATQVVASALLLEGWAWEHLGDVDKSIALVSQARELSLGKNPIKAAQAELQIGHSLYDKSDFAGARQSYEHALREYREIGAQLGAAESLQGVGNVLYDSGKTSEAKKYYEAVLGIDREIGNQSGIAGSLISLGNVMQDLGDLSGAARTFGEAAQVFHENGNKRQEATSNGNLGLVLIDQGNLAEAKNRTEAALALQKQIGYKRGQGFSYFGIAEIFRLQDRLDEARKAQQQAIELRNENKDESNAATSQARLALIALEQGQAKEGESLARMAADAFARLKLHDGEALSDAALSAALLAQGENREAQSAADLALSLAQKGTDLPTRFEAAIAVADANASLGRLTDASNALREVHTKASRYGFTVYDMEARLRLLEIEQESATATVSRAPFEQLEKEAEAQGLFLIARKAKAEYAKRAR